MAGDEEQLYVMRPLEIAACVVTGHDGTLAPSASGERNPRRALELVVLEALQRPPCGVAFSGGRDSSAVLAVAVHVARREGLAEPIPITKVFPDVATTEERSWQERVIDHLGLDDWQRVVIHDELDLLGPLATANLVEHGVVWPPTIHGDRPVVDHVRGGSLIDGEGGDEVLGVTAHRIAPMTTLVRSPRSVTPVRLRRAAVALLPKRLRSRRVRDRWTADPIPWLRPVAAAALAAAVGREEAAAPLSFATSLTQIPRQRAQVLGARNREFFARGCNVELSSPLLHPDVVHALAAQGGFFGVGSRTATLRALVSDLLPDDVLTRPTKATFNGAFWSVHARAFAQRWNGDGVDTSLVDADEVRRAWVAEQPPPNAFALVQQAWLATEGAPPASPDPV